MFPAAPVKTRLGSSVHLESSSFFGKIPGALVQHFFWRCTNDMSVAEMIRWSRSCSNSKSGHTLHFYRDSEIFLGWFLIHTIRLVLVFFSLLSIFSLFVFVIFMPHPEMIYFDPIHPSVFQFSLLDKTRIASIKSPQLPSRHTSNSSQMANRVLMRVKRLTLLI